MNCVEAGAQVRTAEGAEGIVERLRGRDARVLLDDGRAVWRKKDSLTPLGSTSAAPTQSGDASGASSDASSAAPRSEPVKFPNPPRQSSLSPSSSEARTLPAVPAPATATAPAPAPDPARKPSVGLRPETLEFFEHVHGIMQCIDTIDDEWAKLTASCPGARQASR